MGKKYRKLKIAAAIVAVVIAVVGVMAWLELRRDPTEPVYEGMPLTYWLRHPQKPETLNVPGSYPAYFPAIDSSALPFLTKSLTDQDGPFYRAYAAVWPRFPVSLQKRFLPPANAFFERDN